MKTKFTNIIFSALFIGAATIANAQDKATLDLLVSKGVITQGEADKISKDAVKISPKEKTTKALRISGNLQFQYENINVKEFDSDGSDHLKSKNDFLTRRLFLGVEADLGGGWSAKIVTDFATSTYLNDASISKKIDWNFLQGKLDVGYKKVNFGYEENTSASRLLTIERSLATTYWTDGGNGRKLGFGARHTGVFWDGKITPIDGLTYGLAVTNSYNNSPTRLADGADNTLAYWANVAYATKIEDVALKVGLNFGYTNGLNVSSSTTSPVHSTIYGFNPYIAATLYGFDVWSDFIFSGVTNAKRNYNETANPLGLNVGVEYKFDVGEFGKLAPTVRYSWIDTDGRGIRTSDGIRNASSTSIYDSAQSIYVGVNWYIDGNSVKFQLGYEWAQFNGAPTDSVATTIADANAVRAQLQLLF